MSKPHPLWIALGIDTQKEILVILGFNSQQAIIEKEGLKRGQDGGCESVGVFNIVSDAFPVQLHHFLTDHGLEDQDLIDAMQGVEKEIQTMIEGE